MSEPNQPATVPSVDDIVQRPFRFTSLVGGAIVAYPEDRHWAVVVRMDDTEAKWDCYCSDVVFTSITNDLKVCQFICKGKSWECECRVLEAFVSLERIAKAECDLQGKQVR